MIFHSNHAEHNYKFHCDHSSHASGESDESDSEFTPSVNKMTVRMTEMILGVVEVIKAPIFTAIILVITPNNCESR